MAVLSIGPIGNDVQAVISELGDDGRHVAHYDMIFLNPIDEEILQENIYQDKFAASAEKANSLETTLETRLKQIESAIEEIKKNPEFPLMKAIEQHVANITKMVDDFNAKSKS